MLFLPFCLSLTHTYTWEARDSTTVSFSYKRHIWTRFVHSGFCLSTNLMESFNSAEQEVEMQTGTNTHTLWYVYIYVYTVYLCHTQTGSLFSFVPLTQLSTASGNTEWHTIKRKSTAGRQQEIRACRQVAELTPTLLSTRINETIVVNTAAVFPQRTGHLKSDDLM